MHFPQLDAFHATAEHCQASALSVIAGAGIEHPELISRESIRDSERHNEVAHV